ncbi:hypothetical protein AVEN_266454-1 [Araneus ventricosus]|uniref:Uncharacterized protein n=1 Tax=Araneus ventricosus TaxID=182803 RepID=A0A4Y2SIR7_ARAVE|nr:hypothetical protein AVEN_266454-1 [Araneus ventricosus]
MCVLHLTNFEFAYPKLVSQGFPSYTAHRLGTSDSGNVFGSEPTGFRSKPDLNPPRRWRLSMLTLTWVAILLVKFGEGGYLDVISSQRDW